VLYRKCALKKHKCFILQVVSLIYTIMEYVGLFLAKLTNYKCSPNSAFFCLAAQFSILLTKSLKFSAEKVFFLSTIVTFENGWSMCRALKL
jgi:hypothetical protein